MCGICGILNAGAGPEDGLRDAVGRMTATLAHRGPDASGVWVEAPHGVALGHRRLSIIDLSPEGSQPMRSSCGRWVLAYNGEVYNFRELRAELEAAGRRFRGHSDTEVLLEAIAEWGPARALERAWGMFALAAYDVRQRRLFLARDRIGKKPLYFGWCGEHFLFGSELRALRAHPDFVGEVDRDAVATLLQLSYVPAPHAILEGVRKLEPGTLLEVDPARPGSGRSERLWSAVALAERSAAEPFRGSEDDALEALETLLGDAVARRMISDVPLGALLSGGIDSSAVVALMQEHATSPVKTFSIGFEESSYDEADHARAVARHLGTEHRDLVVTPDAARAVIPELPRIYDEPFADTSQLPTVLVSRLARGEVTVALSGDGGDELFGGYRRYAQALEQGRALARLPRPVRAALGAGLRAAVRAGEPAAGDTTLGIGQRVAGRFDRAVEFAAVSGPRELFVRLSQRLPDPARLVPGARTATSVLDDPGRQPRLAEDLRWMMALDLAGDLAEDILVKVDRASMSVGLEVRCPILDHRVVELAWSLPLAMRVRRGETKRPLRRLLARRLPPALFERPKQGFGIPIGGWLRGPLRDWAEALLDERRLRAEGFLDPDAVRAIWRQHLLGWRDRRFLIWNLLMFQAWLEEWSDERSGGRESGCSSC